MTGWRFGDDLPPGSADLIYADPPWRFQKYSDTGDTRSPDRHYDCMTIRDIMSLPVADLASTDSALVIWTTWPFLPVALDVVRAWGFTYKTGGSWHKRTAGGATAMGTGHILRSGSEPFLLATRGRPIRGSRGERGAFETAVDAALQDTRRRQHSRKPEELAAILERLYPFSRRVELFSRTDRPGWRHWGDQTGLFNGKG